MPTVTRPAANGISAGDPVHGKPRPAVEPELQVLPHEPVCPWCRSQDVTVDKVNLGDGIEEMAYICENPGCGAAWPLACVCEWGMRR